LRPRTPAFGLCLALGFLGERVVGQALLDDVNQGVQRLARPAEDVIDVGDLGVERVDLGPPGRFQVGDGRLPAIQNQLCLTGGGLIDDRRIVRQKQVDRLPLIAGHLDSGRWIVGARLLACRAGKWQAVV